MDPLPYTPLPHDGIVEEMERFEFTHELMDLLWEDECHKYGESMEVCIDGNQMTVPRRNYLNEAGTVDDVSLFPYHEACYALLDAYDCIYDESDETDTDSVREEIYHPISSHALRACPYSPPVHRTLNMPGHMPCSTRAIWKSFFPLLYRDEDDDWGVAFWRAIRGVISHHNVSYTEMFVSRRLDEVPIPNGDATSVPLPFGSRLPRDREERAPLLLKLLRHSLSDLQKDYRLAAAVLALLSFRDLDDVDVFRQVLAVIASEFVCCYRPCHDDESMDHDCFEWRKFFIDVLTDVSLQNVAWMTLGHATCLVGMVRFYFFREFGSFAGSPAEESVVARQKRLLKRAVALRADDDDYDESRGDIAGDIPVQFIECVATLLGQRGAADRNRLFACHGKIQTPGNNLMGYMEANLDSYQNCVRALVSIAELCICLLPENERFSNIASAVVWSLYLCLVRNDHFKQIYDDTYMGTTKDTLRGMRISSPLRFASRVIESTKTKHALVQRRQQVMNETTDSVVAFKRKFNFLFDSPPPSEVVSVVRGLFLRNLVDICYVGIGYGDFLAWCRCDVNPLDPALYWNEYAFPEDEEGGDSEEDDDVSHYDRPADWDRDEEDHVLSNGEINARYDFSLLLLQRAWQAPWSPSSHASFQPNFRDAVTTVAQCTHRLGFPHETMTTICSFLRRDWWDDSRTQCWNFECQSERTHKAMERRVTGMAPTTDTPMSKLEYCPHCHVAVYCSKECRDKDFKAGHKRKCNRPPLVSRPPEFDELQVCVAALKDVVDPLPTFLTSRSSVHEQKLTTQGSADDDLDSENWEDDDNDDDSWETLSSGDDANENETDRSKTATIYKYFKEKSYNHFKN